MFTGIVEQIGIVAAFIRTGNSAKIAIAAPKIFDDLAVGESVLVNGVCLTITHLRRGAAEFDVAAETLNRTTFPQLKIGQRVNLERALLVSARLNGHLVTGHVDGIGEIKKKISSGEGAELFLSIPSEILRYLVVKGSVALDGVSLTVADFRDGLLRIALIPLTAKRTILGDLRVGDRVNIEVDLLAKYVEKQVRGETNSISDETMMRVGFLPMGWIDN